MQFHALDEIDRVAGTPEGQPPPPPRDTLAAGLSVLGKKWQLLASVYEVFMRVVPYLVMYAEREEFAHAVPPANPAALPPGPIVSLAT